MGRTNKPSDVFRYIDTKGHNTDYCWPWTGSTAGRDNRGYIMIDGVRYTATHVVYQLFNGEPVPKGKVLRHTCDNTLCHNPTHFELGTQSDNEIDKYKRGRAGTPNVIVREIRILAREPMMTNVEIVRRIKAKFDFKIADTTVHNILSGRRRAKG